MTPLEEKVARAIADQIGPSYDDAYEDKREWTADRGKRHDVNTPYKCDFRNAAQAAIAVVVGEMREPTAEMRAAGIAAVEDAMCGTWGCCAEEVAWRAMLEEFERSALSPTTPEGRGDEPIPARKRAVGVPEAGVQRGPRGDPPVRHCDGGAVYRRL